MKSYLIGILDLETKGINFLDFKPDSLNDIELVYSNFCHSPNAGHLTKPIYIVLDACCETITGIPKTALIITSNFEPLVNQMIGNLSDIIIQNYTEVLKNFYLDRYAYIEKEEFARFETLKSNLDDLVLVKSYYSDIPTLCICSKEINPEDNSRYILTPLFISVNEAILKNLKPTDEISTKGI